MSERSKKINRLSSSPLANRKRTSTILQLSDRREREREREQNKGSSVDGSDPEQYIEKDIGLVEKKHLLVLQDFRKKQGSVHALAL
jgi:hypothetical protein